MAAKIARDPNPTSSWSNFKLPPGGSSDDIRKSVAVIQSKVSEEKKIFSEASLMNGGSKLNCR